MLYAANMAIEQEVIAAAITIALILYLHSSNVHQHSTFKGSRTETCSEALTSEAGLLQNFRAYKKWSRCHLILNDYFMYVVDKRKR